MLHLLPHLLRAVWHTCTNCNTVYAYIQLCRGNYCRDPSSMQIIRNFSVAVRRNATRLVYIFIVQCLASTRMIQINHTSGQSSWLDLSSPYIWVPNFRVTQGGHHWYSFATCHSSHNNDMELTACYTAYALSSAFDDQDG